MKIFLTLLCLFSLSFQTYAFVPGLLEQGRLMVGLIEEARTCSVKYEAEKLTLCTGLTLDKADIKFLNDLNLNSCKLFLKQMKYQVHEVTAKSDLSGIKKEILEDFFNSTKLALILHRERAILFKREAKRGDCLHEVIHFYQRKRPNLLSLSPLKRKEKERRLQYLLEQAVLEVEKIEKKGDISKAKKMAAQIGPFINLQREWQRLINWLDEKEIYQVFFDYPALFSLGERDQDIALSNLVRLKDSLPWGLRERVLRGAQIELNKKYANITTPKNLLKLKSEKGYSEAFNKGQISRDVFEAKVIARRKYLAYELVKEGRRKGKLELTFKGLARARAFQVPIEYESSVIDLEFPYTIKNELPQVVINGFNFVIDTGAQDSVAPWAFFKDIKESDLSLIKELRLQTVKGRPISAPVVQFKKKITLGGNALAGMTFAIADLGMPGIEGVLGMDFFHRFNNGLWQWNRDTLKLSSLSLNTPWEKAYFLVGNGLKEFDALEFYCSEKKVTKLRLDTGSQLLGDVQNNIPMDNFKACMAPKMISKLNKLSAGLVLFDREVAANLGFPFLKEHKAMGIDLKKGELYLTTKGAVGGK